MSLPKRDGVHDRYYLIHKPDTSPEVLAEADLCIQDVLNGTARENHSAYPTVVRNHNGTPFLPSQLLDRYLSKLPLKGFPYEEAVIFCDALRRLVGWQEIRYTLEKYIEKQVQERFFLVGERDDGFTVFPPCTVWPELRPEDVDEGLLRFACYVAVCHTVYGQSFESLTTEHILGLVSQLRPDMVKQLKTAGSGKLPKDIQQRKTEHFTASANDAFAAIRITARDSTEECYAEILDYLCAVLEQEEFPRSYSVEFRGKQKIYLPIPGLPKKGVNQLFACAVQHPNLHPAIERYGDLLTLNAEPQLYIVPSYFAPELVTARDPESGEEFVIFDGGRHGYDNMFCDEHDPSELEHRPLKRYEIPASKLVLELGYSIDYEDEKEDFEPDENDTVELISGERMPWEQVKRDGIDYIALYYVNEKGKPVQILDAELA